MNFSHRTKIIRLSYLFMILIIGIVVMGGYISSRHFFRVDLTQNQEFAISETSKEIMGTLDDIVTVKVFFSKELPPNLIVVRQYMEDILQELSSYAGNNLNVRFVDPSQESSAEEARLLGIPPVRMNILTKDKFEVKNGFLGVALMYGGQHEVLPIVQDTRNIEYDLISAIKKLTSPEVRRIGFLTGHNEYSIKSRFIGSTGDSYSLAAEALGKNYKVTVVSADSSRDLEAIDTLVVGGAESVFMEHEKIVLDQYLMKGGNLVFLLDGTLVQDFLEAQPLDLNLDDLLEQYGVRIEPYFALDHLNETASFEQGLIELVIPYPFWVKAISDNFDKISPIVSKLDVLVFPWVSPLFVFEKEGIKTRPLVSTSAEAWVRQYPFNLDPNAEIVSTGKAQQYPLAVLSEGTFVSPYGDQKFSKLRNSFEDFAFESNQKGRVLVAGNSRFLTDRMVQQYKQNLDFFLNAIDYLTLDETLIGIRSKVVMDRPLAELNDYEHQIIKFAGVFLVPILVIIYGLTGAVERKRKKNIL
ncbi:hypothetical protein COY07_02680 [Candidatus Peregrinibacteria bacterium CG_4_10_14_0_2_um_filter_43_11]|nr:MAG: hypothetical protein COY07_02680 [Candidatus Peregrinibacteria bacterium CG_4_10_14_0_2_um_filter_43_11]